MLALAHHLQVAIDKGIVADRASVARSLGFSRARVTQLLDLLLLAPVIQEQVLGLDAVDGWEPIGERALRDVAHSGTWMEQRAAISTISPTHGSSKGSASTRRAPPTGSWARREDALHRTHAVDVGDRPLSAMRPKTTVLVSLTNNLTQVHTQLLERMSVSIQEAERVGRYTVENENTRRKPLAPPPLEADCQDIFDTARTILATMGQPIFEPAAASDRRSKSCPELE